MESIKKFMDKFTEKNQNLLKLLPYGLLLLALYNAFLNTSALNIFSFNVNLLFIGGIFIFSFISNLVSSIIFTAYCFIQLLSVNVEIAFIVVFLGLILAFFGDYGKNTIVFQSVIILVLSLNNPLAFGIALGIYALYCANRGFGLYFITALAFTICLSVNGLFSEMALFPKAVFETPISDIGAYVMDIINSPNNLVWLQGTVDVPCVFYDVVNANVVYLGGTLFILYIGFRILAGTKRELKEINIQKSILSVIVSIGMIVVIAYLGQLFSSASVNITSLIIAVLGVVIGSIIALFLPNYAIHDILSYEEMEELQKEEKLNQVINVVDTKKIKEGWNSIAGYNDVKEELKQVLQPYIDEKHKKDMLKNNIEPVKGLLLFGPPGTGKTMFAKAMAAESGMNVISVAGSEFTSKWVGESDYNLRKIFDRARKEAPCILFFDEIESFLQKREDSHNSWEKTLVTTFLTQMDGFEGLKDVLVIGATNHPNLIDPAAIRAGRFDKCIYIGLPDLEAKIAILKHYLDKNHTLNDVEIEKIALKLERFSAADIEGFIKEMYRLNNFQPLSFDILNESSSGYRANTTIKDLEEYEELETKFNRRVVKEEKVKEKKYTWNDIAGMDDVKQKMRDLVEKPLMYGEYYEKLGLDKPKGALLYGPPGCGKTLFAKVIADECNAHFYVVNGPELISGAQGQSEANLREVFRNARESKPSIIFFDEFDSIAENRSNILANGSVKIINQLLTEMDGVKDLDGVMVLGATNRIDTIDPALRRPGRLDSVIYIGLPDFESRLKQFEYHLKSIEIVGINYNKLAELTEGFSCADIEGVSKAIKNQLLNYMIEGKEKTLTQSEVENIIKNTNKTLSEEEINQYQNHKKYER